MLDSTSGEIVNKPLQHENGEAEKFYADLQQEAVVGIEATGQRQWFERLLARLGHELWIGEAGEIRAPRVRRQKQEGRDAGHILDLMVSDRFPRRWVPWAEGRDLRQLLQHRHKLVQMQRGVKNALHSLAMSQGRRRGRKLWSAKGRAELQGLQLEPWAARGGRELLDLFLGLEPRLEELKEIVPEEAQQSRWATRRRGQGGVGPVTALALVLTVGPVERFRTSRKRVSSLGLNPSESSSGGQPRWGHIRKQGNEMLRGLLGEAGQSAVRCDPELPGKYYRLKLRRGAKVAKVAIARQLAVRLSWLLRRDYEARKAAETNQRSPVGAEAHVR